MSRSDIYYFILILYFSYRFSLIDLFHMYSFLGKIYISYKSAVGSDGSASSVAAAVPDGSASSVAAAAPERLCLVRGRRRA